MAYRVSTYKARGTQLVHDRECRSKSEALTDFHKQAGMFVSDMDVCVLLSKTTGQDGSGITLASKSTDATHVEIHSAFYA
jgi:hypothetical protein